MRFEYAKPYLPLFKTKPRYVHLWGGRGRGGSFTATQYALQLITSRDYFRGYFMREIFNDIRDSLWRDFKDRIEENETINENDFSFNDSQMTVTYMPTGNTITAKGFKKSSSNRTAKLKSLAGATHVFVEEAEENDEESFRQLDDSLRTTKSQIQIVMVFNPPSKNHWIIKRWYNLTPSGHEGYYKATLRSDANNVLSIHSTYRDNLANLNETFVSNLINYQSRDTDYYYTMVDGLVTEGAKGRIFRNWMPIDKMPNEFVKTYGIDFGFNHPVAVVEIETHNNKLWCRQLVYKSGLTNKDLSEELKALKIPKNANIIADYAEPKSIEELKKLGWNVSPCDAKNVWNRIKKIKEFEVFVTEDSKDLWLEYQDYRWRLDKDKNPTDEPVKEKDDLIDALGYAIYKKEPIKMRAI